MRSIASDHIPGFLSERYPRLPNELASFLGSFAFCANPGDTAWLISFDTIRAPGAFQYNEFEMMSLDAAGDDSSFGEAVRAFWTDHFPIMLSVAGSYQYFAYVLRGPTQGSVVYGYEPEFEEPCPVAASLPEFLAQLIAAARSQNAPYPYSHALGEQA